MAVIRQGNPNRICVHHSAVAPGADNLSDLKKHLASYETTHSKKSWAESTKTGGEHGYYYLAYHIAIAKDGHEIRSQDDKYVLYHAGDNARGKDSFNLHGIGVLLDGNYETELPTDHQKEALARIIARFERKYGVDVLVRGHKQTSLSGTACPGVNIGTHDQGFLKDAIARANQILKNGETDQPLNTPEPTSSSQDLDSLKKRLEEIEASVRTLRNDLSGLLGEMESWQEWRDTANERLDELEKKWREVKVMDLKVMTK